MINLYEDISIVCDPISDSQYLVVNNHFNFGTKIKIPLEKPKEISPVRLTTCVELISIADNYKEELVSGILSLIKAHLYDISDNHTLTFERKLILEDKI